MRKIKFRAWLIKENKLVVPSSIHWNKGYGGAFEIFVDNPEFEPYRDIIENPDHTILPFFTYINHSLDCHKERNQGDDFILEQFTGLKDKNGIEIYDGDICEFDNRDKFVVRIERWLEIYADWIGEPECEDQTRDMYRIERAKIIGNIHENKDLL